MTLRRHTRAGLLFASVSRPSSPLRGVAALAVLLACGCATDVPSPVPITDQRGSAIPTDSQGVGAPEGLPMPGQQGQDLERRAPLPRQRSRGPAPTAPVVPPAGTPGRATTPTTSPTPSRDYADVLRSAFGVPTECISAETREHLTGSLRVTVTVRATPSGRVTSATVSGPGLSATDVTCMSERAEGLRLGPIDDAPRSISATVEYNISGTPGTRSDPETPEWRNPSGAQAPGTVLPAGGTAQRPPGFVPPSSTLPAND